VFNDLSTPASLTATRRSGKPRDMVAPGPDRAQLQRILSGAMRTPDHGKLAPWRFVVIDNGHRDDLAALLHRAYRELKPEPNDAERQAIEEFARQAPLLIVAISCPDAHHPVPVWEQELSAGAACMNLLVAAHAEGFVGCWLTGWAAYSQTVRTAFTLNGRIAGFIFLGTSPASMKERPRPDYDAIVSFWKGLGSIL
jgi:nitroreductase